MTPYDHLELYVEDEEPWPIPVEVQPHRSRLVALLLAAWRFLRHG